MTGLVWLHDVELVPMIELEPGKFSTRTRTLPDGSGRDLPEEWDDYWSASLADSGIAGLSPMRPGSWHVLTSDLAEAPTLEVILGVMIRDWGGPEAMLDPEAEPVLGGGFGLRSGGEFLVEPSCCSDLGDLSGWREAAGYRGKDWQMLWIGHPWLSVRFQDGTLVISEPHESKPPEGRWAVDPGVLGRAVDAAEAGLDDFARRLEPILETLGITDRRVGLARRLAGLSC